MCVLAEYLNQRKEENASVKKPPESLGLLRTGNLPFKNLDICVQLWGGNPTLVWAAHELKIFAPVGCFNQVARWLARTVASLAPRFGLYVPCCGFVSDFEFGQCVS